MWERSPFTQSLTLSPLSSFSFINKVSDRVLLPLGPLGPSGSGPAGRTTPRCFPSRSSPDVHNICPNSRCSRRLWTIRTETLTSTSEPLRTSQVLSPTNKTVSVPSRIRTSSETFPPPQQQLLLCCSGVQLDSRSKGLVPKRPRDNQAWSNSSEILSGPC